MRKIFRRFFSEPLDKKQILCYNIYVARETELLRAPSKMLATRCMMARTKQELLKKSFPNPLTNSQNCDTITM